CIHLNLMIFTKIIRGFISAEPFLLIQFVVTWNS
ncbi:glycolate permease glcA, partial [Klebsiella pneumoniae]|nr:glycolate permease glcA [Klebsiella pneumoniae]